MGIAPKLLSAFLLLCMLQQGLTACSLSDISISQGKTGGVIEGKPEYQVVVSNNCRCPQSNLIVQCFGISSVEPVDPNTIKPVDDDKCILNNGKSINQGSLIKFKYAWMTPQDFPLVSSNLNC